METATRSEIDTTTRVLNELFANRPLRHVSFRFWDGTTWPEAEPRAATIVLKHSAALREMFATGTEKALAEAFLRDDFDIEGDIEAAFELADALQDRPQGWLPTLRSHYHLHRLRTRRDHSEAARSFGERDDRTALGASRPRGGVVSLRCLK
jgi:hypothetical protein